MNPTRNSILATLAATALWCWAPGPAAARDLDGLEGDFRNPPDSARPRVWWHWMNGNVTKAGITADLEIGRAHV